MYSKIELFIEGVFANTYRINKILSFSFDEEEEKITLYYEDYNACRSVVVLGDEDITCSVFDYSKFICRNCKFNKECEKGCL